VGSDSYGRLKRLEVGSAVAVLDNGLTVNDCRLAVELASSSDNAGIAVAPIMSIPAKDAHLAAIKQHLRAVAIVFDFVNPMLAFGRLIDRGSKLGLDESQPCRYAKHERLCSGWTFFREGWSDRNSQFC
jgi:hypothetical protein